MSSFENVGTWWNDNNIELVKIDGEVFALDGWNGERYCASWKCTGEFLMDASEEYYSIIPIYDVIDEDESILVGYKIET